MSTLSNRFAARHWQRHRAARLVAGQARDAGDLVELLDMLGLTAQEAREPAPLPADLGGVPAPRHASEAERDLATALLAAVTDELPKTTLSQ